jgi:DNA-binding IclR family transcriptional regulator
MAQYGIVSVERALDVLATFLSPTDSLGLSELSRQTGVNKTTLLRICSSLERRGYLRRDAQARYRLGPAPYSLGKRYEAELHLDDVVIPQLRALTARVKESTSFHVRAASGRLCMYRVDADQSVLDNVKTGDRYPMDRGAPGKVILAYEGGATPDLVETRRIGYYISYGERDPQCAAVSAPVFKHGGDFCGALSVSGPVDRFDARYVRRILPEIIATAGRISAALGAGEAGPGKKR